MFDEKSSKAVLILIAVLGIFGFSLLAVGISITGTLKEEIKFLGTVILGIFAFILFLKIVDAKIQSTQED